MCFVNCLQIVCLPSKLDESWYSAEEWLKLMLSISYNEAWDASWLTMLCRIRHVPGHQNVLMTALPSLLTKVKELLQLPTVKQRSNLHAYYITCSIRIIYFLCYLL
jgi:hypothetical protein